MREVDDLIDKVDNAETPDEVIDIIPLDRDTQDIAKQIIAEKDAEKVKDLTHLFNLNQRKKDVIRIMKLNNLLDMVSDQMIERFRQRSDNFSNQDLNSYMQVVQSAIDRTQKSLDNVADVPSIQINTQNNNDVTINVNDGLDRDSKEKVADAIKAILNRLKIEEHSQNDAQPNNEGE